MKYLFKIQEELAPIGATLIYATLFGSHLYGLSTENSDTDIVVIYLPNKDNLLLHPFIDSEHHFTCSSKTDDTAKNTSEDYEMKFFSVQWLLKKLSMLEVEACDILFSYTNKETIIYDNGFENIFRHRKSIIDITNKKAFLGYGINQVKKYGLKGESVGTAKRVLEVLEDFMPNKKLKDCLWAIMPILDEVNDPSRCGYVNINGVNSVVFFGNIHQENITIKEFQTRIEGFYNKYGERAKQVAETINEKEKNSLNNLLRIIKTCPILFNAQFVEEN